MDANRNRMILSFLLGCVAGMLLLLVIGMIFGKAEAATKVDIPFPPKIERPVWVPAYVNGKDSWPVSLVFAPFVIVMSAVATALEAPFTEEPAKNLRKTAAVMTIDAVRGVKKYRESNPQPKAASCTVRGNWVGAPCN